MAARLIAERTTRVVLVGFALAACHSPASAPAPPLRPTTGVATTCPRLPAPSLVAVAGATSDEVHERFDLPDAPELLRDAPADTIAARYRDGVIAHVGPDVSPRALIERQRRVFAASAFPRETINATAILEGRVGKFVTPSCLERILFARQAERYPMLERPTEFGAFILRRPGQVRVYMSSMDRVGQRLRREVREAVRSDVAGGFALVAHLHNHPFLFDRRVGDRMWTTADTIDDVAGGLSPSLSDVGFYKSTAEELPLEGAWLTNGFNSIRIRAAELAELVTHETP